MLKLHPRFLFFVFVFVLALFRSSFSVYLSRISTLSLLRSFAPALLRFCASSLLRFFASSLLRFCASSQIDFLSSSADYLPVLKSAFEEHHLLEQYGGADATILRYIPLSAVPSQPNQTDSTES